MTVALPDDHRVLYTLARTVGDALAEAGITLPEGAFVEPSPDTPVTAGMSVRVVQLSASAARSSASTSRATRCTGRTPSLAPGETRTVQGHDGVRVRRYDVELRERRRSRPRRWSRSTTIRSRSTRSIYYPAQTGRDTTRPGGRGAVVRTLHVYATCVQRRRAAGARRATRRTAARRPARIVTYGIVAVDPNVIPLGTKMFIPGYGYAVAADTGGAVKGYIIDLGYPDGVDG